MASKLEIPITGSSNTLLFQKSRIEKWEKSDTVVFWEPEHFDETSHAEVIPLCKKLGAIVLDSALSIMDVELYFNSNNMILDSIEKESCFSRSSDNCKSLCQLMPYDLMVNFFDLSSGNVRLMVIGEANTK